jgi:hypothetical protein
MLDKPKLDLFAGNSFKFDLWMAGLFAQVAMPNMYGMS